MSRIKQTKTNFTSGEISSRLLGRGDLRAYENGALTLRNVFIHPTGGVTRRQGTQYIDTARGYGRFVQFEFNEDQTYLLVFTDLKIDIYRADVLVASVDSPYTHEQINKLDWAQTADTLIICHGEVRPQLLVRQSDSSWTLNDLIFDYDNSYIHHPYYKFAGPDVTVDSTVTSGTGYLYASEAIFTSDAVGTRMLIGAGEADIINYINDTTVQIIVRRSIPSSATTSWKMACFSDMNGWPRTVTFHQDRLVFGGTKRLPNRLWFSKSGNIFNFDVGSGLDDESISFGILSDQVNEITSVVSGRHLQVFTSGAEWMITGDPLTPETVQAKRQTRVGSRTDYMIRPIDVDGASVFVARNKKELREFIFTDVEQAYQSTDLGLLARHIIKDPVDMAYFAESRLLFVVRSDGKIAVLTVYREEAVAAWTMIDTQGDFVAVADVGSDIYFMVKRGDDYFIEKMNEGICLDSCLTGSSVTAKTTWTGLDHLEGETVSVVADGQVHSDKTVSSGAVILETAANNVIIGLSYTHKIEPLPPSLLSAEGGGKAARMIEASFRVENTTSLFVDVGTGLVDIMKHKHEGTPTPISGDQKVRASGWTKDMSIPLWKIEQSVPLSFTLLSVTTESKVNN